MSKLAQSFVRRVIPYNNCYNTVNKNGRLILNNNTLYLVH